MMGVTKSLRSKECFGIVHRPNEQDVEVKEVG